MKPGKTGQKRKRDGGRDDTEFTMSGKSQAREKAEIDALNAKIAAESPPPGSTDVAATEFAQLPLSRYTQTGLQRGKFKILTQIQRIAVPHALAGRDILGAAKTGSGKTLAFCVPLLERLFRAQWAAGDGLAALIISPTRELAMQIFEVLKTAGQAHFALACGLVTGGKDFAEEQAALSHMSILVCTPGRLLQHLEQTADLDVSNLQMLVLDEADRLLDMGFSETLNSILSYLPGPPQRQTLLFSATQTKSVKDLARLSLRNPEYVSVHEKAESVTPARLSQHYVVCRLQDKINMLYSFLRSHLKHKTIVFMSSCKEARFMFEAFRRLRPGVPLQLLHGKMKQARRMLVYYDFLKKPEAVLFATDIAARGLDFPDVDWVLQMDCPEDAATYVHRVGRTARFRAKGHALLVLLPSEAPAMVPLLQHAKIPIVQTKISQNAAVSVTGKLAAEVAADPELKTMAQKAFASYIRSVYLQPNKEVFKVSELPTKEFGESLGLAIVPEVKYASRGASAGAGAGSDASDDDGDDADPEAIRAQAHASKNQNKALMRLKAKIAEEKAKKKAAATAGSSASASGSDSDDDDDSSDSDNDDDEDSADASSGNSDSESDGGGGARGRPAASSAMAAASNGKGKPAKKPSAAAADVEDDLFVPKAKSASRAASAAGASSSGSAAMDTDVDGEADDGLQISEADLKGLNEHERARVFKIIRDTRELGASTVAGGRDKDGLTPFQRLALEKAIDVVKSESKSSRLTAAGAGAAAEGPEGYAARVAARLAAVSSRDREQERDRVRSKHKEARRKAKGLDEEDAEEEEGVQLAMPDEEDGGSDDGSGAGSGGEESDAGSASSSDEDDEDHDGESSSTDDDDQHKPSKKSSSASAASEKVEDMEALALQMMAKKRRV